MLVDTEWVAGRLDDDSIRILEVDEELSPYLEGHIPGAIGFDWKRDLQNQVRRDLLDPVEFGALMGRRGIANHHTVVLYGDCDNWFAAYAYWCFVSYGHDKAKLMNGSRGKWISEGRELQTEVPTYPPAKFEVRPGDETIRARREEVRKSLGSETRLVDVRSPREFSGELIAMPGYEHQGAQRSGHIPGAISVPWTLSLNDDGTLKSADELRELYASRGVPEDGTSVIAYCLLGGRSAHTWFVLHELLGYREVKNYDGGWTEWGSMVGVPVERGASG